MLVTMADYKQFGDPFQHEPWTASTTPTQLMEIESTIDPWDLASYLPEAKHFCLNCVHCPFWRDWPLAESSLFLMSHCTTGTKCFGIMMRSGVFEQLEPLRSTFGFQSFSLEWVFIISLRAFLA